MITIKYAFDLSFIFFIAMSQTMSVINRSGACFFTLIKLVLRVLVCAYVIIHIKWKRLILTVAYGNMISF